MAKNKAEQQSMTIEQLAIMVKNGFEEVHKTADERFKIMVDEFDRIRSDIRDIKITLGPLVRIVAQQEEELNTLKLRVNRLEREIGLTK